MEPYINYIDIYHTQTILYFYYVLYTLTIMFSVRLFIAPNFGHYCLLWPTILELLQDTPIKTVLFSLNYCGIFQPVFSYRNKFHLGINFKEPFAHYQKPCQFFSTPSRIRTHTLTSVVLCAIHYTIGAFVRPLGLEPRTP